MNNPTTAAEPQSPAVSPMAIAEAMLAKDAASKLLNMQIREADVGRAALAMEITEEMVNGHGSCHGGMIFCLADTTFATACNSHNRVTVGSACHIDYIRPGYIGDTLTATAVEQILAGRNGIYDITICNQYDEVIAVFRGRSRTIKGEVINTSESQDLSHTSS